MLRAAALLSLCLALPAKAEIQPSRVLQATDAKLLHGIETLPVHGVDDEDKSLAPYFAAPGADGALETLPLKETSTEVTVAGVIAHVRIRQTFENTGARPIEAVYTFPASTRAAVHGMRMTIGSRTIEAKIEKRETAREKFEAARANGQRAGLLEQQRPNGFTTSVTNLMPKDRVIVELVYSELLVPDENVYELVVPTVVGPRYEGGADSKQDTWVSNPYLQSGEAEPYAFDISVQLESGLPLRDVSSPSHPIAVAYDGQRSAKVTLEHKKGAGTRDFVLRYRLAGEQIEAGVLAAKEGNEGFFAVMIEPPQRPTVTQVLPREYIFVLDVSGSMGGFPLDTAKTLMRNLLGQLRPDDRFNVVLFAGYAGLMSPRSITATPDNLKRGLQFVSAQAAGGGTELLAGLERAYTVPQVNDRVSRTVVVVTDGYVAVEGRAFKYVREHLDAANLFAFGIGTSVNRGIIEGLARAGAGEPYVVLDAAKAEGKAEQLRRAIERPLLTNIRVRYHGLDAREVTPMQLPDLMANRPLVLFGKFQGEAAGEIEVTGDSAGKPFRQVIKVAPRPAKALQWLWARSWIETLEDQYHLTGAPEVKDAVTDLGLTYKMLTPFTSFIAVDSEVANKTGAVNEAVQPLPLPTGVPNSAVGHGGKVGSFGSGALQGSLKGSAHGGNVFGPGGLGTGSNNALGGLQGGAGLGDAHGVGGLGTRGSGSGGGGYGLGVGGVGTKGRGGGAEAGAKQERAVVLPGNTVVLGSLARDVIVKVVKRHQNEVRYCYEVELQKQPQLKGKLVVTLTIDATGTVTDVTIVENGLGSDAVASCIAAKIRRWKFPASDGAGVVKVTYPWTFAPPAAEN